LMRRLLLDLEDDFRQHSGEDQVLDADELTTMWTAVALKKNGKLSDEEQMLIKETSLQLMKEMDADGSGKVSYHEFVAHSMGAMEARGALRSMRDKINEVIRSNPEKLSELVEHFKAWDKNGDGYVTVDELEQHLDEIAMGAGSEDHMALATKLKEELLSVADVDSDGKMDMWELVAWALGRKKQPVELLLYDISKGATQWLGPLLLGRFDVEAFHSGLLVFGSEYWYGGKVFRTDAPCEKQFGPHLQDSPVLKFEPSEVRPELHVIRMGYTMVTHDEFVDFLQSKVIERYTGIEKYDLLSHSCNHFADECLHFLIGRGVPDHVLELQNMALTPNVKSIRPYLNRYLGGFSAEDGGGDQLLMDGKVAEGAGKIDPAQMLGEGAVVVLDGGAAGIDEEGSCIVATIVREEEGGTCEVRYFDPREASICTKTGVNASAIQKRIES